MGNFFKSKTQVTQAPFESNPWEPQQDYLKQGFSGSLDALKAALSGVNGITDLTADLNPGQLDAIGALTSLGLGQTQKIGDSVIGAGKSNLGDLAAFGDAARSFNDYAGTDRTGQIIDRANQYADNPALQGVIDSSLADVRRAFDMERGDINAAATGTGNINSTRAGALEARALDDAMDRSAQISSGIRANAYESGLDRSMATDAQSTAERLQGASLLGQSGTTGLDTVLRGLDTKTSGLNTALGASGILQGQDQAEIEGQLQKLGLPMDFLSKYMTLVGGNYGSQGYQSSVSQKASPFQTLLGAATSIAGAL